MKPTAISPRLRSAGTVAGATAAIRLATADPTVRIHARNAAAAGRSAFCRARDVGVTSALDDRRFRNHVSRASRELSRILDIASTSRRGHRRGRVTRTAQVIAGGGAVAAGGRAVRARLQRGRRDPNGV